MLTAPRQVYEFDEFCVLVAKRQLLRNGEVVPLYSKAFDLLLVLVRNEGRDLTKDEILETVWPGQILEESNLSVNISRIRKALGETAASPRYLVTIPGQGYRFVANLRAHSELDSVIIETEAIAHVTVEEEIPDTADALNFPERPALPAAPRTSVIKAIAQRPITATLIGMALVISVVGIGFYLRSRNTGRSLDSIAVLPFVNAGNDPNTEYLSDGITESFINSFSQLPRLRVVPRSVVFRYKGRQLEPQEIGRQLGVAAVMTGRIVQRGDTINIQTELVDIQQNAQVWGKQYDVRLNELQSMPGTIISELRPRLSPQERQKQSNHTPSPEAYQAYLKGRYFFNQDTFESYPKSEESFKQAIRLDPDYALPYAGLAALYTQMSARTMSPTEAMTKAKDATLKALALDGSLAEAHFGLARIHWWRDWDFPGAEREFKRAIELNPNDYASYMMYGSFLSCAMGRFDEGSASVRHALEIDPLSILNHTDAAYAYYCARKPDLIIQEANKIFELDSNSPAGHHWLANGVLLKGDNERAVREFEIATKINGRGLSSLAYAYALAGRRADASRVIDDLQRISKTEYVSPYNFAFIYAALGDKDHAFEWLEKAFAERNDGIPNIKNDPWLDNLRSDPRYPDLVRRVGLTP